MQPFSSKRLKKGEITPPIPMPEPYPETDRRTVLRGSSGGERIPEGRIREYGFAFEEKNVLIKGF